MTDTIEMAKQAERFIKSMVSEEFIDDNPTLMNVMGKHKSSISSVAFILKNRLWVDRETGELSSLLVSVENLAKSLGIKPAKANDILGTIILTSTAGNPTEEKIPDWIVAHSKTIQSRYMEKNKITTERE